MLPHKFGIRLLIVVCLLPFHLLAQKAPSKFGSVNPDEFKTAFCDFDSAAHAMYLFDFGETYLEYSGRGWQLVTHRHSRIIVFDKSGIDVANRAFQLYTPDGNDDEGYKKLNAVSYNLENGKIVETKMEKTAVFKEKTAEDYTTVKFTVPNVRAGSIFEVEYTLRSDYIFFIDPWYFQHDIPVKRSEYHLNALKDAAYNRDIKGYFPVDASQEVVNRNTTTAGGLTTIPENVFHYVAEKVPHFPDEPYLYTPLNYISSVSHSLVAFNGSGGQTIMADTWGRIGGRLLDNPRFGGILRKKSPFKDLEAPLKTITDQEQRIKAAFELVKAHYAWNGEYSLLAEASGSKSFDSRTGNTADINLSLVNLLNDLDIKAQPAIISTRKHGIIRYGQVGMSFVNTVIAMAKIDTVLYFMDASNPWSDVNMLPPEDYNLMAITFDKEAFQMVEMKQSQLYGFKANSTFEIKDDKLEGQSQVTYTGYGSYIRRIVMAEKKDDSQYFTYWAGLFPGMEISEYKVSGKDTISHPLVVNLDASFPQVEKAGNLMLIQPWIYIQEDENPFKSAKRDYPVEFDFPEFKNESNKIKIPAGYAVESLPKPMKLRLPDGSAKFTCTVTQQGDEITVNVIQQRTRTLYLPDEYGNLRQFYQQIVDKEKDKIVLKKL